MHPADCPEWNYDKFPNRSAVLSTVIKSLYQELRLGRVNSLDILKDTRPAHKSLFIQLTPKGFEYFAGNYRGSAHRCLEHYAVMVHGDPRVGAPPNIVVKLMADLSDLIHKTVLDVDQIMSQPDSQLSEAQKILYLVAMVCNFFQYFLRIHPYADGNGHTARFCVWAFLGRYNFWLRDWPVEPRPSDPPYRELIVKHRNGDKTPLENFILKCMVKY